jgi:hypothetical protein
MKVGYCFTVADSKSRMFPSDALLCKCRRCGYRLDFFAHNPQYILRQDCFDLCATYDGQLIGSLAFKRFCEDQKYSGISFLEFELDEQHFHVIVERQVPFDFERRQTRFENLCQVCGNYESIAGATPAFLRVQAPLADGIYRTDLLFASGDEKCPLHIVGIDTKAKLIEAGLRGICFENAEGLE